ncbi:MAG: response regulator [Blastocatellia bacterium]|nr:response regulator [Blastocatellia bacterium]
MFRVLVQVMVLVGCVLLCGQMGFAHTGIRLERLELPVDISAQWKYCPGDDMAWARPDFNDQRWQSVNLDRAWGRTEYSRFMNSHWYRLEVQLPWNGTETARHGALGIAIGNVLYSSYEVYAGGEPIGRHGTYSALRSLDPAQPRTFLIPERAIAPDGRLVLAVRMWRDPYFARIATEFGTDPQPPCLIGFYEHLRDRQNLDIQNELFRDLPRLILAVVFLMVGAYHLQLYRRRRELKEYLWFGLLTVGATTNIFFLSNWPDAFVSPNLSYAIGMGAIHWTCVLWFQFVWVLFRRPWGALVRTYQYFQFGLGLVTLCAPVLVVSTLGVAAQLSLVPVLYLWLFVIPKEAFKGDPEARTICIGILCLAGIRFYQFLVLLGLTRNLGNIAHWGFLGLILSVAFSLSNRFSRVYQELDTLNQDLEEKVKSRTAQLDATIEQLRFSEKEALLAQEAAIEANRAKSMFLAKMSHELRTPLNAIIGFVQLMRRNRSLDGESLNNLNIIARSGEHLLGLINDILSISKIEAGQTQLNEAPFDVRKLLEEIEQTYRLRAEGKGLQLLTTFLSGFPPCVKGDEGKLRQILINIVGNALKFTEKGKVEVRVERRMQTTVFEIEDTGPGIAREELPKLFEIFGQTSTGTKTREGTGLGLAISRSFAQLMGGDITVSSEVGKGTTFRIVLPLPETVPVEAATLPRHVIGLASDQRPVRMLVTDDVEENRLLLQKLLEAVGFETRLATNGAEAVQIWQNWHPDLIWMDIRMPVMDGMEAARRIRELEKQGSGCQTKEAEPSSPNIAHGNKGLKPEAGTLSPEPWTLNPVVIIALTASAFEHDREVILGAGCDDVVTKPFQENVLFEKAGQLLHISYVYSDAEEFAGYSTERQDSQPISSRHFVPLPLNLLAKLNQVITEGDLEGAFATIEQIKEHDETLAEELRKLVKGYKFDDILDVLGRVS